MRILLQLAGAFLLILIVSKCAKEYSYEGGGIPGNGNDTSGNAEPAVKSEWEFKQASTTYAGPVDTAYLTQEDNIAVLSVTGKSKNGAEKISFTIRGMLKIEKGKTYNTSREEVRFLYTALDTIYSAIPYIGGDIYLSISDIADNKVTGTFKGLALKSDGRSYEITEGKFSSPLKKVPASEAKGYIQLWAIESCNGPIKVKVNSQPGVITKFSGITPTCGDEGSPTYNFSPGTYNWVAYCGRDSVFGKAELKAGSCTKILISFPIKPAVTTTTESTLTCKLSDLSYNGNLFPIRGNNINASYTGNIANAISYFVKVPGWMFYLKYTVFREGNKLVIEHPSGDYKNYFITDAAGRVVEYVGNTQPENVSAPSPEFATYEYDNNNHLIKRTFYKDFDRRPINDMVFTWNNGNITKMTQTSFITGTSLEYEYEYFTNKPVKAMPFIYTEAQELMMYQPVINWGTPVKNLPIKMKIRLSATNIYTYDFYGYVIDDNDYVQSMRLDREGGSAINFNFQYKCF